MTVLIVIAALAAVRYLPVQRWLPRLLEALRDLGPWGLIGLVAIYVPALVLCVPAFILALSAGFLAGALWPDNLLLSVVAGTLTVSVGSTIGATVAFQIGRTLARDWVARWVQDRPVFEAVDRAIEAGGLRMAALVRISPLLPFNLLNYALGATRVTLGDFIAGTFLGKLPASIGYVYAGSVAQSFAALSAQPASGALQLALLVVGLIAMMLLALQTARVARRALEEAMPEDDGEEDADAATLSDSSPTPDPHADAIPVGRPSE